jgi:hypothetical protein
MFAIEFRINPEPPQIRKVKITPFRSAPLRNFPNSFTPPFLAPQFPAG